MRTDEQIIADCRKRTAEIKAEAKRRLLDPTLQRPCTTCRFCKVQERRHDYYYTASLVVGFGRPVLVGSPKLNDWKTIHSETRHIKWNTRRIKWKFAHPCGPEKALWRRKPTIFERIVERIIDFFEKNDG